MNRGSEIEAALQEIASSGQLGGAATLVWRNVEAQTVCVGWRDVEANLPVERDTIFRIASMTKPITSVAALRLVEEGRIALTDPIARYAPEFSHMRVLRAPNGPLDETDPVERPITVEDLLTHRAGFTYADFHRGPIAQAYRDALAAISIVRSRPISGSRGSRSYH
jgi:CubicO group peptidase (beta-lactamase class C family)